MNGGNDLVAFNKIKYFSPFSVKQYRIDGHIKNINKIKTNTYTYVHGADWKAHRFTYKYFNG